MSLQQVGKKMVEEDDLDRFLDAYEEFTGQRLMVLQGAKGQISFALGHRGKKLGVELTRPHHDHETVVWDWILSPGRRMSEFELLHAIHSVIEKKTLKLSTNGWRLPQATILVVQLVDYTFSSWEWLSERSLRDDFASTGFAEIWLADHGWGYPIELDEAQLKRFKGEKEFIDDATLGSLLAKLRQIEILKTRSALKALENAQPYRNELAHNFLSNLDFDELTKEGEAKVIHRLESMAVILYKALLISRTLRDLLEELAEADRKRMQELFAQF